MATSGNKLKVWNLHPKAARVIKAERTLNGTGHPGALKLCGPYTYANQSGFWLFPAVDVDIMWKGGKEFEVRYHEEFDDSDFHLLRKLVLPQDTFSDGMWSLQGVGRNKFTFGMVEDGVVQMWTGNIFETPPGWCLHIRSPVNWPPRSCYVMEGVLETDFMQQDIWTNIVFTRPGEWVEFRKDGWPPLAQLQVIRREGFTEKWEVFNEMVNRDTPEASRVFEYWVNFNEQKFARGGKQAVLPDMSRTKDGTTFYKEKARCLGGAMEPKAEVIAPHGCPFHKPKDKTVVFCINDDAHYQEMFLHAVDMLRKHNATIPVKLIYIDGKDQDFMRGCARYNVQLIQRPWFRPEAKYFSINKYWLRELQEDSVLYLDVDLFINGDLSLLFDKYRTEFTAIESKWAYTKGWKDEFLPNGHKPVNSGVQLFHGGFHRKMFAALSEAFDRLSGHDMPLAHWSWNYYNGCLREELACTLILAEINPSYSYFEAKDCYNIERNEDVAKCHESIIFHSYTRQWELVKKWSSQRRKMVWPKRSECGTTTSCCVHEGASINGPSYSLDDTP